MQYQHLGYGLQAAIDHSGKSRRTLYNWRKQYQDKGLRGLQRRSTAPKRRRRCNWPLAVLKQMRYWRTELPNLGKEQSCVDESYIESIANAKLLNMNYNTIIKQADIVLLGSFNPAIFHPEWFIKNNIIAEWEYTQKDILNA